MGIAISTIIMQGLHTGDADRNFGEAFAPRPPKTISDDDRDRKAQPFFQFVMELSCGTVRIFWQEKSVAATIDIRSVDSAVGADQALTRFGDQNSALAPHDSLALCQGHLGYAGVELVTARPRAGSAGGFDLLQGNKLTLRFGDDFVFYDQDVARSWRELEMPESMEKFVRQRIAGTDIISKRDWKNAELYKGRHFRGRARAPVAPSTPSLICRQRQVGQVPLPRQALGVGFAGRLCELAQVGRIIDV